MICQPEQFDIKREIEEKSLLSGDFLLRSGQRSSFYFDKYQFEGNPRLLFNIAHKLYHNDTDSWDGIDFVAGLEMGGISIATAISLISGVPLLQVRKRKKKYGTAKIIEGPIFEGRRVAIIEDVITSGGSVVKACKDLRKQGAIVDQVYCVILRDQKGKICLDELGLSLYNVLDFSEKED